MFPFVDTAVDNDNSIGQLRKLAGAFCGIEHSDWIWEWQDGGRAAFKFKDKSQMMNFQAQRGLAERFDPEWAHKRT
jgi:hypothetical protein